MLVIAAAFEPKVELLVADVVDFNLPAPTCIATTGGFEVVESSGLGRS